MLKKSYLNTDYVEFGYFCRAILHITKLISIMVHIYFFSNDSSVRESRVVDFEFKKQDLRNSIQCVLSYNRQVINYIIGCPAAHGDDSDVYFSVFVDKENEPEWFDLFADAVVSLLKYSLSVYVPQYEDYDVMG